MIEAWLKSAPRPTTFCTGVSAAALAMSFAGVPDLPADPAWIAVILCDVPILYVAGRGIMDGFDIRAGVLVSLALIAALLTKEYFAAGEVALIMQIGTLLEDWTVARARAGLEGLAALAPQMAHRLRGDVQETVPAAEVRSGDLLVVRAGETVPVDGTVTAGESAMDAAVMTGESLPVDKRAGDAVISGTVNTYGTFTMRAEKAATDSSLQRMIALAREADAKKAPIVRLADRWALARRHRAPLRSPRLVGNGRARARRYGARRLLPLRLRARHADGRRGEHRQPHASRRFDPYGRCARAPCRRPNRRL